MAAGRIIIVDTRKLEHRTNPITGQKLTFVSIAFGSSSLGLVADSVISVMTPFAGAFQPEALSFVVKQV
jgi:hypothetical protein